MSDVRWIKITTSVFDDEKIKLLETLPDADMIIVIWFKLLSLAGRCNDCGMVYLTRDVPYNDEMLSTIMRRPVNTVRLALHEFCKLGMIEIHDNFISIVNWEKHQNIEGLERMREKTRKRVQKYREKQQLQIESNVTRRNRNAVEKKREEKNREEYTKDSSSAHHPDARGLTQYFYDFLMKEVSPPRYKNKKPDLKAWEKHIDLLLRVDGQSPKEIKSIIDFTVNDNFWRGNILSTAKLREKYDTLYLRMKSETEKTQEKKIWPEFGK